MRQDSDDRKTGRPQRKTRMSLKIPVLIIVLVLAVVTTIALMLPVFNVVEVYCEGNSEVKGDETEDDHEAAVLKLGKNAEGLIFGNGGIDFTALGIGEVSEDFEHLLREW